MSEINLLSPETIQLTEEAAQYAEQVFEQMQADLLTELPATGHRAHDEVNAELREKDRTIQKELDGTGFVYFGHTRKIWPYMYNALLGGYNPSEAQLAQEECGNFLYDEISELYHEHPDIYRRLGEFGYLSELAPITPHFVGAYVVPENVVKDILGTLFMRGQEYRDWGWGFPWISDEETGDAESIQ